MEKHQLPFVAAFVEEYEVNEDGRCPVAEWPQVVVLQNLDFVISLRIKHKLSPVMVYSIHSLHYERKRHSIYFAVGILGYGNQATITGNDFQWIKPAATSTKFVGDVACNIIRTWRWREVKIGHVAGLHGFTGDWSLDDHVFGLRYCICLPPVPEMSE